MKVMRLVRVYTSTGSLGSVQSVTAHNGGYGRMIRIGLESLHRKRKELVLANRDHGGRGCARRLQTCHKACYVQYHICCSISSVDMCFF